MELKDLTSEVCKIFNVESAEELPARMMDILKTGGYSSYFDRYIELLPDLTEDWIARIYQFYLSDRIDKKQDFTPKSLAMLVALLTAGNDRIVYDCCSGTGSLLIARWSVCPDVEFIVDELDENVIPLLLFNMCIRNINGRVRRRNILTGETFQEYAVIKGDKYSSIAIEMFPDAHKMADAAICNPPFNLSGKFEYKGFSPVTANFAFVMNCLDCITGKFAVILPSGVLSSDKERKAREELVEAGWLKAAIACPEKMFDSTSVSTNILLFDKRKTTKDVLIVDATDMSVKREREMRGEKHTCGRIYMKEFNAFSVEQIIALCGIVNEGKEFRNLSKKADLDELRRTGFNLTLGPYKDIDIDQVTQHRDFNQIVSDINRVIKERNKIRLTVNKVWAKKLGLEDIIVQINESRNIARAINESFFKFDNLKIKEKIIEDAYMALSASKIFLIENIDKEGLSSILEIFIPIYKQHIYYLNDEENRLLAELRDSMLPLLMSGTIKFKGGNQ